MITFVEFNNEGFLFLGSDGCNSLVGVSIGVACIAKMVTCITKMITSITVTGMGSMAETGITETGIMGSKVGRGAMLGNIVTIDSWDSYWGSYWGSYGSWGSVGSNMGHRLGDMVGNSLSFVQRLVVGGLGLNNRFLGKDGLVFNDGVGDMLGGSNGTRDHFGNGSGFMNISGLSNGVGNGRHLGGHLSEGMGLSHSVGKVTTQTVGFD